MDLKLILPRGENPLFLGKKEICHFRNNLFRDLMKKCLVFRVKKGWNSLHLSLLVIVRSRKNCNGLLFKDKFNRNTSFQ